MPRTEKPLDPLAGPVEAFAHDLRELREKAGMPPYRTLARRAGYSASTLSIAASGTALPSLDVTLAYVQACGGDPGPWRERRQMLAAQQVRGSAARPVDRDNHEATPSADKVGRTQRSTPVAMVVAVAPPPLARRYKFGARRLSAVLATGMVLLVILGAAGAINRPTMPAQIEAVGSVGRLQIENLYNVICWQQSLHVDADVPADLGAGRDSERDVLIEAAATLRMQQAYEVKQLDVNQVPDGPHMVTLLHDFWANRAAADSMYLAFADDQGPNDPVSGSDRTFLQDVEREAQQAGSAAAHFWNLHAQAMGEPQISERTL
ncbi:MAG TPA: helix-turn-helix transcriptional regulator [Actinocrinis sp.]|uniref:helix-turn-helix domain-containing protein n=1 Tax=Actinocrinis sp. TaxID=1920516 RepID=UPI002DDD96D0|nr:helix-turn-helix transcriptional regulator [Actinocrinis sp.]HEV2343033.1 helix-turn-helix transcriptional regulator [Actinocrinis sp.]